MLKDGVNMQCKDIDENRILEYLRNLPKGISAMLWDSEYSVVKAFPEGTPEKIIMAKMKQMIKKGLVDGCACGCRGDFTIKMELKHDN